jgi:hypothetical protein
MGKPAPLATVADAIRAIQQDRLALVTYTARMVHVSTAFGAGSFRVADWREAGGPQASVAR